MSEITISNGVMFNAYPDSIGEKWSDTIKLLKTPEFKDAFSLFYVLPTFFNSDLDRGFSIIDYNLNEDLVTTQDLRDLDNLNIKLKFDIVLNHLSVASPQFKDLLKYGEQSKYKDFFINWNQFWGNNGSMDNQGVVIPEKKYLDKLFMRKSGLPILKVPFPDGSEQPYWNTFYQDIKYQEISINDLKQIPNLIPEDAVLICEKINQLIQNNQDVSQIDLGKLTSFKPEILKVVNSKRHYLGQMDVNAKSPLIWEFYEETLEKVNGYGCNILRLDAFAYLHKEVGQSNFFNKPGTWDYLERIKKIAQKNNLMLLPEIHAEYGLGLHDEVASKGYYIYDFFLPGLVIHTLETGCNTALLKWINEIVTKKYKTVNMLGCHDGIPVLDLKGKAVNGNYNEGLLEDKEIEAIMDTIISRGGRVKNLYGPSGTKISYYQVNATFFSALGEDEKKLLLARAIQMFVPGIPQVWYLDIFAGKNDYEAADNAGSGGHKEINRTTLSHDDIEAGLKKDIVLKQLEIIKIRNTCQAFTGNVDINTSNKNTLDITWQTQNSQAQLLADLKNLSFTIQVTENNQTKTYHY